VSCNKCYIPGVLGVCPLFLNNEIFRRNRLTSTATQETFHQKLSLIRWPVCCFAVVWVLSFITRNVYVFQLICHKFAYYMYSSYCKVPLSSQAQRYSLTCFLLIHYSYRELLPANVEMFCGIPAPVFPSPVFLCLCFHYHVLYIPRIFKNSQALVDKMNNTHFYQLLKAVSPLHSDIVGAWLSTSVCMKIFP
jgi:hypothetical protein